MSFFERQRVSVAVSVAIAFGVVWFLALHDRSILTVSNVGWMIEGDWMGHLFGWLFSRNAPWGLPLAQAPQLVWPAGSSAALTDAIPLLTVAGKLLSPFFGLEAQFFGWWMLLGMVGLGVTAVLVLRQRITDPVLLALVGVLFVVNPIVSTRYGHPVFYWMWVLTGLVGLNFWQVDSVASARRTLAVVLTLDFVACAINPYVAVMASVVTGAAVVRLALLERRLGGLEAVLWVVAAPLVSLSSLALFGFISGALSAPADTLAGEGFGQFSADPLTFFNATQWSRFLPGIPMAGRQYEGYAYLGFGVVALLVLRLVRLRWDRPGRREVLGLAPVVLGATLLSVYALSNHVVIAQHEMLDLTRLYAPLGHYPSILRSSGRFVWPMHALLTFVAVLAVTRMRTLWHARAVLAAATLLQVVDFNVALTPMHHLPSTFVPWRTPEWNALRDYQHLAIQPVQIQWTCPFNPELVAKLSWEAYRHHLSINSGLVGRAPPGTNCQRHLTPASLDRDTVYVPYFREFLPDFLNVGWVCGTLEGVPLCVSPERDTELKRVLAKSPLPTGP